MTNVIVTDLTRMSGSRICIAGYDLDRDEPRTCIRPELKFEQLYESWLYSRHGVIRPFSIVDFTLIQSRPEPPHVEDWLVQRTYTIVEAYAERLIAPVLAMTCAPSVRDVYGDALTYDQNWFVPAGTDTRSLCTIAPAQIMAVTYRWNESRNAWQYRIGFNDAGDLHFSLSVTDLCVRYALDSWRNVEHMAPHVAAERLRQRLKDGRSVYLRLGLSRPFGDRRGCYLQVTGVHTIPDLFDGRCHADFRPEEPAVEVPF